MGIMAGPAMALLERSVLVLHLLQFPTELMAGKAKQFDHVNQTFFKSRTMRIMTDGTASPCHRPMNKFPVEFLDFIRMAAITGVTGVKGLGLGHLISLLIVAGGAILALETGMEE